MQFRANQRASSHQQNSQQVQSAASFPDSLQSSSVGHQHQRSVSSSGASSSNMKFNDDPLALSKAAWEKSGAFPREGGVSVGNSKIEMHKSSGAHINHGFIVDNPPIIPSSTSVKAAQFTSRLRKSVSAPDLGKGKISRSESLASLKKRLDSIPAESRHAVIKRFFVAFGGLLVSGAVFSAGSIALEVIYEAITGENAKNVTPDELDKIIQVNSDEIINVTMGRSDHLEDEHDELLKELKKIATLFRTEMRRIKIEQKQISMESTFNEVMDDVEVFIEKGTTTTTTEKPWYHYNEKLTIKSDNTTSTFISISDPDPINTTTAATTTDNVENNTLLIIAAVFTCIMIMTTWFLAIFIIVRCIMKNTSCHLM